MKRKAGHNKKLDASENLDRNHACNKDPPSGIWMIRLPVRSKLQNARGKLRGCLPCLRYVSKLPRNKSISFTRSTTRAIIRYRSEQPGVCVNLPGSADWQTEPQLSQASCLNLMCYSIPSVKHQPQATWTSQTRSTSHATGYVVGEAHHGR